MLLFYQLRVLVNLLIEVSFFLNPNLFKEHIKNSMRPTGIEVHSSLVDLSPSHALLHKL